MAFYFKVTSPNGANSANWTMIFVTGAIGDTNTAAVLLPTPLPNLEQIFFFLDLPLVSPATSNVLSTDFSVCKSPDRVQCGYQQGL